MSIGVFCTAGDETARRIARCLNRLEAGCAEVFGLELGPGQALSLHREQVLWNGRGLEGLELALVSGLPYMDPVVPPPAQGADWSLWNFDHLLAQQRYSALESVFQELERRGVRLVNPRRACLAAYMKGHQLLALGRRGCKLPALLCSNDPAQVADFCARYREVLWRPATGRAAWQRFTDKQRTHLVGAQQPPVLLCEGPVAMGLHRAWVLDGEPLLCVAIEPAAERPVETLGARADYGELAALESLEMLTVVDAGPLRQPLGEVARAGGAAWVEVAFVPEEGGLRVYDVDPDPRFDCLPPSWGEALAQACARALLGLPQDRAELPAPGSRMERPSLFLRRALQIQFEMERSKYPPEAG